MKKIVFIILFLSFSSIAFSKDICFVMEKLIRPYKNLIDNLNEKGLKNVDFIIGKRNYWKVKNYNKIVCFGESSFSTISKKFYSKNKFYIYTFLTFNLYKPRKNEILFYLQPSPEEILEIIKKFFKNKHKWLSFYSDIPQKNYLLSLKKAFIEDNYSLEIISAQSKINLNEYLEKNQDNYEGFIFIPDPLYSSAYVIEFLIEKLTILKKITIGFNDFFIKAGATFSFKLDYSKTAKSILDVLNGNFNKFSYSFAHKILVNKKNLEFIRKNEFK